MIGDAAPASRNIIETGLAKHDTHVGATWFSPPEFPGTL